MKNKISRIKILAIYFIIYNLNKISSTINHESDNPNTSKFEVLSSIQKNVKENVDPKSLDLQEINEFISQHEKFFNLQENYIIENKFHIKKPKTTLKMFNTIFKILKNMTAVQETIPCFDLTESLLSKILIDCFNIHESPEKKADHIANLLDNWFIKGHNYKESRLCIQCLKTCFYEFFKILKIQHLCNSNITNFDTNSTIDFEETTIFKFQINAIAIKKTSVFREINDDGTLSTIIFENGILFVPDITLKSFFTAHKYENVEKYEIEVIQYPKCMIIYSYENMEHLLSNITEKVNTVREIMFIDKKYRITGFIFYNIECNNFICFHLIENELVLFEYEHETPRKYDISILNRCDWIKNSESRLIIFELDNN